MSEIVNGKTVFSLLEVTRSIQKTISERYHRPYWIKAEMNKLNFYRHSGHCFPELVEKSNGKIIAQIKGTIWKEDYLNIAHNFQEVLKEPLRDGIKILFLANIFFDPVHGLALNIINVDPSYTLGDLEREKQETIKRLKNEGLFDRNKQLKLPLLPQRIAIISVETSKGYADFIKVLETNPWNYKFLHLLFPSLLQGERAVDAIIQELDRIKRVKHHFDLVAVIRGGGGDIGLSCYNSYRLAKEIAMFPLPILTGIGHATNETVSEMVAFANAITPTKLAEYLLQKFHDFSEPLEKAEEKIINKALRRINDEKQRVQSALKLFSLVTENIVKKNRNDFKWQTHRLVNQTQFRFSNENQQLTSLADRLQKGSSTFLNQTTEDVSQVSLNLKKGVHLNITTSRLAIYQNVRQLVMGSRIMLQFKTEKVSQLKEKLSDKSSLFLKTESSILNGLEKNIDNMDPRNVLKRGYSMTLLNGKNVTSVDDVKEGNLLQTVIIDGVVNSIVKSSDKTDE